MTYGRGRRGSQIGHTGEVQRDRGLACPALDPAAGTRAFDEDAAHGLGSGGVELAGAGPAIGAVAGDPGVGLMDQIGGVERVTVSLAAHSFAGDGAEL